MERSIEVDDQRVEYSITYGSGASIVLLGGVKRHFLKPYLIEHLQGQDVTLVVPRLTIADTPHNLPLLSHQLDAILENEGIVAPLIIGLREGGTIGTAFALERHVERLFLVDPVGPDFSRLDSMRSLWARLKLFLIRMLLWYAHDHTWHRFFLECMEFERTLLSLNTQIVVVEHEDLFTNHHGIRELQRLTPRMRTVFTTGNRLTTQRPYELINRMMAWW